MSWNFSGAVVGSVGSVQFQIVPCPSSYLFSMSVGPLQCLVSANYRALICHSCHFQSGSASLFWLPLFAGLFSVSFPPWWGGRGAKVVTYSGSLVQLCCGEGRTLQQTSLACVGSTRSVRTTLGLSQLAVCASGSTLLRLQGALQERHPKQGQRLLPFPGLSRSGSWLCTGHRPGWACVHALPRSKRSGFWVSTGHSPGWACVHALPRSKLLRFPGLRRAQTRLGVYLCPSQVQQFRFPGLRRAQERHLKWGQHLVPFPGLSAQVLGSAQGTDPAGRVFLPFPGPSS